MSYLDSNITLFWPSTGIALVAVLIWGLSCWPGIFLGSLAVNLSTGDLALATTLGIALSDSLGPTMGAFFLKRSADFQSSFMRSRDILTFILIAAELLVTVR